MKNQKLVKVNGNEYCIFFGLVMQKVRGSFIQEMDEKIIKLVKELY